MATPKPEALRRRSAYREPVRRLCDLLEQQLPFNRPAYLVTRDSESALIVPAAGGGYEYLHVVRQSTWQEARTLGLVELRDVDAIPAYSRGGDLWSHTGPVPAQTITLTRTWLEATR